MKRAKNILLSLYFQVGVNIIGLPEYHKHLIYRRSWEQLK